jgi:hypothetical protein
LLTKIRCALFLLAQKATSNALRMSLSESGAGALLQGKVDDDSAPTTGQVPLLLGLPASLPLHSIYNEAQGIGFPFARTSSSIFQRLSGLPNKA